MRKIYIVPNLITTANLFCGFYSITASIEKEFTYAAWAILAAAVFDTLDGRIARLAKATSQFGVEYDSMSDLISFGLAPSILLYEWALQPTGRLGMVAAFLYTCCAALRLARFNVNVSFISKAFFQGIPSPIAAGSIATFMIFHNSTQWPSEGSALAKDAVALILTLGLGTLMVSTILFPSFKEMNWRARSSFGYLMIGVITMVSIAIRPDIMLFALNSAYILGGLTYFVYRLLRRRNRRALLHSPPPALTENGSSPTLEMAKK